MDRQLRIIQWIVLMVFWFGELAFASSSKKAVFIGSDLELRCNNTHNATWWFDNQNLHGNTQLINNTLILKISNVSVKNQGTYWCGLSWKHGYNVSVVVGTMPSEPRSVQPYSYEWDDSLHWVASLQTGGLPVYYTVTALCPKVPANLTKINFNCQENGQKLQILCKHFPHIPDKKYSCPITNYGLDLDAVYQMCVLAINELGNSSVCVNFTRSDDLEGKMTIPAPLLQLKAIQSRPGEVKLTWKARRSWMIRESEIFVYISYYKEGDIHNTTINPVGGMDKAVIIPHLEPYSFYTFYARCQYRTIESQSVLSAPSVVSLMTSDGNPDKPQNLTCSQSGASSNDKRNIFLSWKPVPKESQRGLLAEYIILVNSPHRTFNMTVNASQTSIVLPGFRDGDDVRFNVRACNEGGFCSGIGNTCVVSAAAMTKKLQGTSNTKVIVGSVIGAFLIAVVLSLLGLLLYDRHKRKKKASSQDPVGPVINPPDPDIYIYPEHDPMPEEYTQVNDPRAPLIIHLIEKTLSD